MSKDKKLPATKSSFDGISDDELKQQIDYHNKRADEIRIKHMRVQTRPIPAYEKHHGCVPERLLRTKISLANLLAR
jgi:hypothetical protein